MDAFIGEIRAFANSFYPVDWYPCLGQRVSLNDDNAPLFSIIGTYYGPSDMRTYFTLPKLQGRTLVGPGGQLDLDIGERTGEVKVTLSEREIPEHSHSFTTAISSDQSAIVAAPESNGTSYLANFGYQKDGKIKLTPGYVSTEEKPVTLNPSTISQTGGNLSHDNMSPFLAINYYICYVGYYPPRPR